ncbi:S1 RNA-binding domain-containing protein [Telluribacter sp. SYSU D00476]|uniref:CvfB family protein n=1 Tax=Telluribacter sp. SYSU D00476 TaxID=2811430 RepID=UPI001FF40E41|nr:S1-like domain-containing RNA-binding protein [Telluribacter sp. SYSU D00476]
MLFIGKYNTLTVLRRTSVGLFLGDVEGEEVLLPNKYVTDDMEVDEDVRVFVYKDSEDRPVATTETPKVVRNEFAYLQVKDVNEYGAFLDWGLEKDLFVPFREQNGEMRVGEWYLVYLYLDRKTNRLSASAKIGKFLDNSRLIVDEGDEVDIIIWERTDLGYNVIVNHFHKGLIYENELFRQVNIGDQMKAYVKRVREENKLDISLEKQGYESVEPNAQRILDVLKKEGGFLNLSDNSSPEEIKRRLEMSKKTFKKAIGGLYKQGMIQIQDQGIRLISED